jgi:hypothetical protein
MEMGFKAASRFSTNLDSLEAGIETGTALIQDFSGDLPKVVLVYSSAKHDQSSVLQGLRKQLGATAALVGCSVQGVVSNQSLTEEEHFLGVMGLGGKDLSIAVAAEQNIDTESLEKGQQLARKLKKDLGAEPNVVIVIYDPLCGADVEALLRGMRLELQCPLIGGGSGQPWGPPVQTFQYLGQSVFSKGMVALALSGPFSPVVGICHGTIGTGDYMTVTKAEGNRILELDGQSAIDIWRQITGCEEGDMVHQNHLAAWALGIEQDAESETQYTVNQKIRGAFGFDFEKGAVVLQAAVPVGTKVKFQRRTVENVMHGSTTMAEEIKKQLAGKTPKAVFGFECAARTYPFLGPEKTKEEHAALRSQVAPQAPWLGMMAWGEIGPCNDQPTFHNYTYPLLVLVDA